MNLVETTSNLKGRLRDVEKQVKDVGRTSSKKLDEARHWTAEEVQGAASSVRKAGQHGSRGIDDLASATADKLDSTAAYVRNHDPIGIFADLGQVISRHRVGIFASAAAIGFLLAVASRAQQRQD